MANIEFRSEPTYYFDPLETDTAQLVLPLEIDDHREVHWLHGRQETRRKLFGKRIVTHLITEGGTYLPKTTYIDASAISELSDPDLRYALRFADAAEAVGWTAHGSGCKSSHYVGVTAVDAGVDSKFIGASYTGVGEGENDTFMQNLHSAAPISSLL